ncbi:MAG: phosphoenolpyruvate synthase [Hyphomicrobiales bacterium]|nr:phosphoenolpyruvate synthase [Hyphomicrobiales bacterium]MCP5000192.1 phosphoenolpyruvate synthase [Hyphomicrobiales bacterium]
MNAETRPMVLSPKNETLPESAGGKGRALARLDGAGFNPPSFFVVLPGAFDDTGLKAECAEMLAEAIDGLGNGPFAVRSSGAQEDGTEHSHAGQFLSLLNIEAGEVADAAHKVWLSGDGGSVTGYREMRNLAEADPAPAVVVQRMINASAAGVAFSADPIRGLRHHAVVSAVAGLGDRLVSGEEDGETWTVDTLQQALLTAPDGDTVLTPAQALEVAHLACRVEEAFGLPQDIEWAFEYGVLHILQARPITTELKQTAHADPQLVIYDNSNIVESYPGLVTPLTYSFARYAYTRVYQAFVSVVGVRQDVIAANAPVFENMLGRIDGRVYYNLVNWYRALALLPGFAVNRAHMETMMGVSEPLPETVTASIGPGELSASARWLEYGRLARAGLGLVLQAMRLNRTIRGFQLRLDAALGPQQSLDVGSACLSDLVAEYRRIEASLLDNWDAPIVNDFLCMMAFGASRKLMERWFGQPGLELHNHVMIGQGDIISAELAKRIAHMGALVAAIDGLADDIDARGTDTLDRSPELRAEFDAYIERFGDRCTEELKLESVTLDEDPSALLAAVAASARRPASEKPQNRSDARDFASVAKGKPVRRMVARLFVGWAKARVRDRENLRFERTRIFGRARKLFLAMGRELAALGHLEEPRDVFYLTVEELVGAVEGFASTQILQPLVKLRRAEMEASATRNDPPERITVEGASINVATSISNGGVVEVAEGGDETMRAGTACSAGNVTATARVIRDPATESLQSGEILVARHTDPGWIAVFSNASAIVVERGSLLSHSAIVAREMGIPCVVALKGATAWIRDGETITVDGTSGEVTRKTA